MTLKVFADRMSQPSRAVILFCKLNKIDFEEVKIDLFKRQHLSPEFAVVTPLPLLIFLFFLVNNVTPCITYTGSTSSEIQFHVRTPKTIALEASNVEINPLQQVPAIVDGRFKLYESHAILIYLACAFPGVADHWYPADVNKRVKIHSVLDWHHLNLRYGAMRYVVHTTLGPALGRPLNSEAAAKAEKILDSSLSKIESVWLKGSGKFLLGSYQPSIADLSLVCEIMQLEVLDEKDRARILSPYKKVREWIEATKASTQPHFNDVHGILYRAKKNFQKQRESATLQSKM